MEAPKTGYEKLGPNIRALRNVYGLTLQKMADDLEISIAAISYYEKGERFPDKDILLKIANYLLVTETQLLRDDFADIPKDALKNIPINNKAFKRECMKTIYPRFSSEEALENHNFKTARHIQKRVYDAIFEGVEYDDRDAEQFIGMYQKALDEGVILSAANILSFLFYLGEIYSAASIQLIEEAKALRGKETNAKAIASKMLLSEADKQTEDTAELEQEKLDFLKEYTPLILKCIAKLKRSEKFAYLGDYYLALRYIYRMVRNGNDHARNSEIGYEMMRAFKQIGNPRAKKFLDFFEEKLKI